MNGTVGWQAHRRGVAALTASYAQIAPEAPVRLAKKTSNLFRPRQSHGAPGLDVSGLAAVIEVDVEAHTADVQGMCTYEDLVDTTLPLGFIPYVVPQLRSITLGGAVTGLGIESTSLRNGLPHESVLEMDILTGTGEVVTASPDNAYADLFAAFPNSYGSLGYATRLKIELEPVPQFVELRHVRLDSGTEFAKAIAHINATGEWDGVRVDAVDGTAFTPDEVYLSLASWSETPAHTPSDYTGEEIYYRSIQRRRHDTLTMYDYLWRWDTDWFWCSGGLGLHNPRIRRLWPRRWRRSDVYHKVIRLDRRFDIVDRLDRRAGRPQRERVIQDIEIPAERVDEFLRWFDAEVGMRPVWLCPLRLREPDGPGSSRQWTTYPLEPGTVYVNAGFWGTVHVGPEAPSAPINRAIEAQVHELGGHKSLYSEAFYNKETFDALYNGRELAEIKDRYDPDHRLLTLYDKAVQRQ